MCFKTRIKSLDFESVRPKRDRLRLPNPLQRYNKVHKSRQVHL